MSNPFAFSLLLGAAMYAAIGLFGLAIFHGAGPASQTLTDGYGIANRGIAAAQAAPARTAK